MASTVAPSDTSTSIVIDVDAAAQMKNGRVELGERRDITFAERTLADGTVLALKMDLLLPKSADAALPVVVHVPGGAFLVAAKDSPDARRRNVAEAGFAVASVEYRTTLQGAVWTDGVADVKSGIRHLRAHADEYGIDAGRIAVWGESAGGYLAAMVGVTNGLSRFDSGDHLDRSSEVAAVVDMFGAGDLSAIAADFDDETQEFFRGADNSIAWYVFGRNSGTALADDPGATTRADPATYISASTPPFLLFHGTDDHLISPSQTLTLHNALREAGADSTRYVVQGAGHGDMAFLGDQEAVLPWSSRQVMGLLIDFLHSRPTQ
ncbi:alpha/beta hydrolase fold domain-containing protein [Streptomyces sp. NPDC058371]|uniref:alpha/beta hydrolase fold domain-containing protein n=1 Tax=Streptomyces sp. NPDC058371 TaxID=3346463 RepID=UPI0036530DA9